MANEDYKPIDMREYPYKSGDILDNGIIVTRVVKGTKVDSFAGYEFIEQTGVDHRMRPTYGDKVILKKLADGAKGKEDNGCRLKFVGPVGDPMAQWVYYKKPNENKGYRMRPDEFIELVKGKKEPEKVKEPEVVVELCKATTKAGQPCKGKAVTDGYCMSHAASLTD